MASPPDQAVSPGEGGLEAEEEPFEMVDVGEDLEWDYEQLQARAVANYVPLNKDEIFIRKGKARAKLALCRRRVEAWGRSCNIYGRSENRLKQARVRCATIVVGGFVS